MIVFIFVGQILLGLTKADPSCLLDMDLTRNKWFELRLLIYYLIMSICPNLFTK